MHTWLGFADFMSDDLVSTGPHVVDTKSTNLKSANLNRAHLYKDGLLIDRTPIEKTEIAASDRHGQKLQSYR